MSSQKIRSYGSANKDLFLVDNRKNSFNSQSNIVNSSKAMTTGIAGGLIIALYMHPLRVFSRAHTRARVCLRLRTNKYYSIAFAIPPSIAGGLALEL